MMKTFTKLTITALTLTLAACSASETRTIASQSHVGIREGQEAKGGDAVATSTVELVAISKNGGIIFCSASIIDSNLILTAGHCVSTTDQMYIIFSTDTHLESREEFLKYARPVDNFIVHPQYARDLNKKEANGYPSPTNDVALLHFKGALPAGFKPAQLLKDYDLLKEKTTVTVAGYGVANDGDYITAFAKYKQDYEKSQKAGKLAKDAPPMPEQVEPAGKDTSGVGKLRYTEVSFEGFLNGSEVLLDQTKGTGSCEGDSGGPAFLTVNNQLKLFGVASRGNPRAEGSPCMKVILYTAIAPHIKFLSASAKELTDRSNVRLTAKHFFSKQ